MVSAERPISVSDLCHRVQNRFSEMGTVVVIGEISQLRVVQSGHCYATLKDADATLSIAIWRSTLSRLAHRPREGERVIMRGQLSLYAPRGIFSADCQQRTASWHRGFTPTIS